jgi:ribosomal protein L7/L12
MKLDKVRFATLISYISRCAGVTFSVSEIVEIDDIIDMPIPEPEPVRVSADDINMMMELMSNGNRKIDAIKLHRQMTGYALKESKDAVEKYWPITRRIADALGTEETGEALVEVARNAHKAERELASQYNEPASLGDIQNSIFKR